MIDDFDVIVIGGGSAGSAMAGRLADAKLNVLLLEAGKTDVNIRTVVPALTMAVVNNPEYDTGIKVEPDQSIGGRADIWPTAHRLGGGSAINGMIYVKGHMDDYNKWSELGADGWSGSDVAPYFKRQETNSRGEDEYRGGLGPISVADNRVHYPIIDDFIASAMSYGIKRNPDHNGKLCGEGTDYSQASQKNGLRCSSAKGYLRGNLNVSTLTIKTEATVHRVLIENNIAVGVEYAVNGEMIITKAKSGVVMSAGSLNTPRLLMLSGIGDKDDLAKHGINCVADLPGVGENLQEHVGTHIIAKVNKPTINSDIRGLAALKTGADFIFRRRGAITSSMCHAQSFVKTSIKEAIPDVQVSFTAFAFGISDVGRAVLFKEPAISLTICVARPESRGKLTLRSSNPIDPPIITHKLLDSENDINRLARGIEIGREMLSLQPIVSHMVEEVAPSVNVQGEELKAYVQKASIPLYHPVGTCRMGQDDMCVVDPELKVRGVSHLWVADASVMPTLPIGNTNATAIMIGDKGSDHVLRAINISNNNK